ncbi:phytoene desaturase family protein [Chitinispirillales bacterium ANBcel5]|uniref:phytoene desaturase family protein n=1 Tax=Cellulosispirillum alkaliphilum TaxID=3039283 RepID=UPI002A58AAF2|nr:phytoene desaturase family protein [Chitinispirillales bacterium ANBcel5]
MSTSPQAIVIGAGLGGLSTALSLAAKGWKVEIYEKNSFAGGKLSMRQSNGFHFDLGPSLLTMPHVFKRLFSECSRNIADYLEFIPVTPHWRLFFEDKNSFDLTSDMAELSRQLSRFSPTLPSQFFSFLSHAEKQRELIESSYFYSGAEKLGDILAQKKPTDIISIDFVRSMKQRIERYISEPHLLNTLAYFCKYVGSSALNSPGFLTMIASIQFTYGVYHVKGGMYKIVEALKKVAQELGVTIHYNAPVTGLWLDRSKSVSKGVILNDGEKKGSDIVLTNMDTLSFYTMLKSNQGLKIGPVIKKMEKRFEPSCSGIVLHLGTSKRYPQLAHHNIFHSNDPDKQYRLIFDKHLLPDDPTLYVVAPLRSDPSLAANENDIIKVLPQIPYINDKNTYTKDDMVTLRTTVLEKLERMGLDKLRDHITEEIVLSPWDIEERYGSYRGSIYGVVCDRWKNLAFKPSRKSHIIDGLYFTGGSVNPGSGMPMVILGAMETAKLAGKEYGNRS